MNPAAKVFGADELRLIADLVIAHDAYAICDEVYEHILFDGRKHVPLMSLPGMRERAVRPTSSRRSPRRPASRRRSPTASARTMPTTTSSPETSRPSATISVEDCARSASR